MTAIFNLIACAQRLLCAQSNYLLSRTFLLYHNSSFQSILHVYTFIIIIYVLLQYVTSTSSNGTHVERLEIAVAFSNVGVIDTLVRIDCYRVPRGFQSSSVIMHRQSADCAVALMTGNCILTPWAFPTDVFLTLYSLFINI